MTTIAAGLKYYIFYVFAVVVVVVGEKEKKRERARENGEKKAQENANVCVHTQLTRTG